LNAIQQQPTPEFIQIIHPGFVAGLPNGVPLSAMGLPSTVLVLTTDGLRVAGVQWNLTGINYNRFDTNAQVFDVWGWFFYLRIYQIHSIYP
jgi:hypothetical protein